MSNATTHTEHDRRRVEAERVMASLRAIHGADFPAAPPDQCRWSFNGGTATLYVRGIAYSATSPSAA